MIIFKVIYPIRGVGKANGHHGFAGDDRLIQLQM